MENREKNFWDMQKNSIAYAQNKEEKWKGNAIITGLMDDAVANEAELNTTAVTQVGSKTNGVTGQKNQKIVVFGKKIYRLGRKVILYGKQMDNIILVTQANFTELMIEKLDENALLTMFGNMLQLGRKNLDNLLAYGLTAAELDSLDAEYAQLKKLIDQRNLVGEERKGATRNIKEIQTEGRNILEKLDDAFEGMLDDDEFIAGWFEVRKIKGRKSSPNNGDDPDDTNGTSTTDDNTTK